MPRSRSSACSAMPASSPGWRRTGRTCSPAAPGAREHAIAIACRGKAGDRGARRARDRRPRAAQSRPHLRACVRGRGGLFRQAPARRGGRARHRAARSSSRPGSACCRRTRPDAWRDHLAAVGLPTHIREMPAVQTDADALMALIAQDKKVKRGKLTFILVRGIGQAFVAPDVDPAEVRSVPARRSSPDERDVRQPHCSRCSCSPPTRSTSRPSSRW